ncbi:AAA family ATPase [Variovorax sp. NFACC27]|uniref:AAA family ATPase n=1 Tax=unclassified Variovorax TaxID=663243 RepID=UPI00089B3B45|nr:Predicted ATP-binding protein involved in virulence [Variovorax sp. NFACC28]SEG25922.1 Predicted ATP-binding protein involved in virulence [Variovorax sp. NFACC29]SFC46402.1 Predicted ATP-binding protein involved in virulence [Variovorax sp. NFACC26]SFF92188.1 Predicted ATP-binding protein involved in virulence [Variovorax sp. NFACC27]
MSDTEELVRVRSIKVSGLFGLYIHNVNLTADRVTIIHGPNGVGKTVFLKLTHAFISGRYAEFAKIRFDTFEVMFSDGSVAELISVRSKEKSTADSIIVKFTDSKGESATAELQGDALNIQKHATNLAEQLPFVTQVGPDEFIDRGSDEFLTAEILIERYGDAHPRTRAKLTSKEPKGLRILRNRIKSHFIEAQRLIRVAHAIGPEYRYRPSSSRMTETVQAYSEDLKKQIDATLANYAKQSQKLDQSFPQRLIEGSVQPFPLNILKEEMQRVEASRSRLRTIGLLDRGEEAQNPYPLQIAQLDNLDPTQISVMSVYARDTVMKLEVLENLASRVELLLNILNKKFTNKTVGISREFGLIVKGSDNQKIAINALSSGEQHEIVLLYDLLFKTSPNTLVLIDEPELSLHVSWQRSFLDDLLEVIRLARFDVLLATHSPYIVGDRSDLMAVLSSGQSESTFE